MEDLSPEDREFLEKMNVKLDEPQSGEEDKKTCPCPWCRFERGDLPHPMPADIKEMERWTNKALDRLPPMKSLDLAVAIASAVSAAVFAGYAVGIDHARREKDDGDVDRGL